MPETTLVDNEHLVRDDLTCTESDLSQAEQTYCMLDPDARTQEDLINTVGNVLSAVYFWVGILAVIMIISGGVQYTISQGDPGKVARAKQTILYAIIGLVVALSAFAITSFTLSSLAGTAGESIPTTGEEVVAEEDEKPAESEDGSPVRLVTYIRATDSVTIAIGQTVDLKPKIIPTNATHKNLTFESNDETIATVDETGRVKAIGIGAAEITIKSEDGPTKTVKVEVFQPVLVTSLTLNTKKITVEKGKTAYITATVTPSNAANKTLTWTSANANIATITNAGKVTGKTVGKTTITVSTNDGTNLNQSIEVQVTEPQTSDSGEQIPASGSGYTTQGSISNKKAPKKLGFTAPTSTIVEKHKNELTYNNYDRFMRTHGGNYDAYVKSLGGIFTKYEGESNKFTVKSAADLQIATEYTAGLFTIWGIDYDNGKTYHYWGNGTKSGGTSDGFYVGSGKRYAGAGMSSAMPDKMLKNRNKSRTNCNYGVDSVLKKTKLGGPTAASIGKQKSMSKVGKITNTGDLQVGDLVHFFHGSRWGHVALVGEVYKDYVILYDFGGRFIESRNYKQKVKRGVRSLTGTYATYGTNWYALRIYNINQNTNLSGL